MGTFTLFYRIVVLIIFLLKSKMIIYFSHFPKVYSELNTREGRKRKHADCSFSFRLPVHLFITAFVSSFLEKNKFLRVSFPWSSNKSTLPPNIEKLGSNVAFDAMPQCLSQSGYSSSRACYLAI